MLSRCARRTAFAESHYPLHLHCLADLDLDFVVDDRVDPYRRGARMVRAFESKGEMRARR